MKKNTMGSWKRWSVATLCILGLLVSPSVVHAKGAKMGRAPMARQAAKKPNNMFSSSQKTQKQNSTQKAQKDSKQSNTTPSQGMMGRFGGILGGVMAGLGLAALASYLGVGQGLLGMLVLGVAVVFLVGLFRRWMSSMRPPQQKAAKGLL